MIVTTNCPNCSEHDLKVAPFTKGDRPVEIKEQRFELYTRDTEGGFLPASCTVCGADWELHYKLAGVENLELDSVTV